MSADPATDMPSASPSKQDRANSSRTNARRRAVEVLYEAEERGLSAAALASQRLVGTDSSPSIVYAGVIVNGVSSHATEIDEWLSSYSHGWSLSRMPAVDRAILRAGTWELVYADDVPDEVTMKDAADLASDLSTEGSPKFVSGLLGAISKLKETLI